MIDYSRVFCVTDLKLADGRLSEILNNAFASSRKPAGCILRAKEIGLNDYTELAKECKRLCDEYKVALTIHSYPEAALELGIDRLHMPLKALENMSCEIKSRFRMIGTSVHSREELKKAKELGAGYAVAGHIFETDCKKGMTGRGLDFLRSIVEDAEGLPVYAIGGIGFEEERINRVLATGAGGVCIMSDFMKYY